MPFSLGDDERRRIGQSDIAEHDLVDFGTRGIGKDAAWKSHSTKSREAGRGFQKRAPRGRTEVSGELASAAVEWLLMARFQLLKRVEKRKKTANHTAILFLAGESSGIAERRAPRWT